MLLEHLLVSRTIQRTEEPLLSREELVLRYHCLVLPGSIIPSTRNPITKMAYTNHNAIMDIASGKIKGPLNFLQSVVQSFLSLAPDSRDDDVYLAISDVPLRLRRKKILQLQYCKRTI
ncbi:hypothetical protein MAR_034150 [Mya arenaria]|uniref:Uncharacterized protein n=1 Tax=Mya arenaria TaxID=6604 RepID=A0ABY7GB45_MYAAR|nr:hypothetical protein MAR_034150 [Mya arenaria]